jgi:hypothetical protein
MTVSDDQGRKPVKHYQAFTLNRGEGMFWCRASGPGDDQAVNFVEGTTCPGCRAELDRIEAARMAADPGDRAEIAAIHADLSAARVQPEPDGDMLTRVEGSTFLFTSGITRAGVHDLLRGLAVRARARRLAAAATDGDRLRLHLASTHCQANALELTDAEAADTHEHEHDGPGTIRNHPRDNRDYDPDKVVDVVTEQEADEILFDPVPACAAGVTIEEVAVLTRRAADKRRTAEEAARGAAERQEAAEIRQLLHGGTIRVPLFFAPSGRDGVERVFGHNGHTLFLITKCEDGGQDWLEVSTTLPNLPGFRRGEVVFSRADWPDTATRWAKARDWCALSWSQFLAGTCGLDQVDVHQRVKGVRNW